MKWLLVALLLIAAPLNAQTKLNRWDRDQWEHMAAGAGVALVIRGPWIDSSYNDKLWKRGAWQLGLSLLYEKITNETAKGYNGRGLDWTDTKLDIAANMAGWLVVEGVVFLWEKRKK